MLLLLLLLLAAPLVEGPAAGAVADVDGSAMEADATGRAFLLAAAEEPVAAAAAPAVESPPFFPSSAPPAAAASSFASAAAAFASAAALAASAAARHCSLPLWASMFFRTISFEQMSQAAVLLPHLSSWAAWADCLCSTLQYLQEATALGQTALWPASSCRLIFSPQSQGSRVSLQAVAVCSCCSQAAYSSSLPMPSASSTLSEGSRMSSEQLWQCRWALCRSF